MNTLKDYVNFKLTHADKIAEANGYPLKMENCKKYKKMRDLKVYGNSVQDGTPTPDAPIEVQSVGELTYNLLNDTTFKNSDTITGLKCDYEGDGVFHIYGEHNPSKASGELYSSMFALNIPVEDVDSYYSVRGEVIEGTSGNLNTHFFLSVKNETTTVNFDNAAIPSNSKVGYSHRGFRKPSSRLENATSFSRAWLYFTFNSSNEPEYLDYRIRVWVYKGEDNKPYEPYGKYKIPLTIRGKNMASIDDIKAIHKGDWQYLETTVDGRECIRYTSGNTRIYYGIKFKENTQYTISAETKVVLNPVNNITNSEQVICIWYTDGTKQPLYNWCDGVWRKRVITSAANKTIKAIGITVNEYRVWSYVDINTFQVEEGTTATDYEPYQAVTTNIFLNEPLRKIGDYADYIDFKENKVVRNVAFQTLLSSASWDQGVAAWQREGHTDFIASLLLNVATINNYKIYSNRFKKGTWTWSNDTFPGNYIYTALYANRTTHLIIQNECLEGITNESSFQEKLLAFKKFLDTNETYITYVRSAPIEEPLNIDLPKLTAKTTIIEVDTNLLPSNAYGKYIKK